MRSHAAPPAFLAVSIAVLSCGDGTPPTVTPPAEPKPTAIQLESPQNPSAEAGTALAEPLVVRVTDQSGRGMSGVQVAFGVTAGGGSVAPQSGTTGADGRLEAVWTMGPEPAVNRLQSSVSGVAPLIVEARSWTLEPRTLDLAAPGDSARFAVNVAGTETSHVELTVTSQHRWLHEVPVLDPAALARGTVRATGAGHASVTVRAGGVDAGPVSVSVAPVAPLVFSVAQPDWPADATVVVRGYRIDALPPGAVVIGGDAATVVSADSASLRLDPGLSNAEACVDGVSAAVEFPATASLWDGTVLQPAALDTVELGETRTFTGRSFCLRLAPAPGARYALAQVDRYLVDRSRDQAELHWDTVTHPRHSFGVTIRPAHAGADLLRHGVGRRRPGRAMPAPDDVVRLTAADLPAAADVWQKGTPWVVGDTFTAEDRGGQFQWRVMRTYAPNFVLAIERADSADLWPPDVVAVLDSAFAHLGSAAVQARYRVFGDAAPATSPGSGQVLVLLRNVNQSGVAICRLGQPGIQHAHIAIGRPVIAGRRAASALSTLAHELAHVWHCAHRRLSGTRWAVEGLADLIAIDVTSDFRGLSLDGNVPAATWNTLSTLVTQGFFTSGYAESESFMTHAGMMMAERRGVPWTAVLEALVLGSTEGWHGRSSTLGPGFTARMRALGDPDWDPVDARLDWVLSVAVDDRAAGPAAAYRYPPVARLWEFAQARAGMNTWGIGFYRGTAGAATDVQGVGFPGGNGYVLVDGSSDAIPLRGEADIETMVWRLLRYQ